MLTELPRSVFVLKVGSTYYHEFGTLRALLSATACAAYKSDIEPFSNSSLQVVETPLDDLFGEVQRRLSHLYIVVSSWGEDGEIDAVVIYDPAAAIN